METKKSCALLVDTAKPYVDIWHHIILEPDRFINMAAAATCDKT